VIRNGHIESVITEYHAKVSGFWDQLKSAFSSWRDLEVVYVDTSPIQFSIFLGTKETEQTAASGSKLVGGGEVRRTTTAEAANVVLLALSCDKEIISAECHIGFTIDMADASKLLGLFKGRSALAVWDLADMVRADIVGPVLVPLISNYNAADFRGTAAIRNEIEQLAQTQLSQHFSAFGLTLKTVRIAWGLTETEAQQIAENRGKREEAAKDFALRRTIAEMQREMEIQRTRITNDQEIQTLQARGEIDLAKLYESAEDGKRINRAEVEAKIQSIQLGVEKERSNYELEKQRGQEMLRLEIQDREFKQKQADRLAQIDAEDKEMAGMVRMQIQMASAKHDREMEARKLEIDADVRRRQAENEARYQDRQAKLQESMARMGMMERIMAQGLQTGAANADVLKTMLEQSTEQEYATTSDDKVKSRSQAQAAKANLDTFKQAEDRERQHQIHTTQQAANMMQASKQTPPSTVIAGAGVTPAVPPPAINVVNVPQSGAAAPVGGSCPACGVAIKSNWKACPECGASLSAAKCKNCGAALKPTWKACPMCGTQLT
jgi:hypothetical protein